MALNKDPEQNRTFYNNHTDGTTTGLRCPINDSENADASVMSLKAGGSGDIWSAEGSANRAVYEMITINGMETQAQAAVSAAQWNALVVGNAKWATVMALMDLFPRNKYGLNGAQRGVAGGSPKTGYGFPTPSFSEANGGAYQAVVEFESIRKPYYINNTGGDWTTNKRFCTIFIPCRMENKVPYDMKMKIQVTVTSNPTSGFPYIQDLYAGENAANRITVQFWVRSFAENSRVTEWSPDNTNWYTTITPEICLDTTNCSGDFTVSAYMTQSDQRPIFDMSWNGGSPFSTLVIQDSVYNVDPLEPDDTFVPFMLGAYVSPTFSEASLSSCSEVPATQLPTTQYDLYFDELGINPPDPNNPQIGDKVYRKTATNTYLLFGSGTVVDMTIVPKPIGATKTYYRVFEWIEITSGVITHIGNVDNGNIGCSYP